MKIHPTRISLLGLAALMALAACRNPFDSSSDMPARPEVLDGAATARLFVPDYLKLAAQDAAGRAVPPQASQVRLSIKQGDGSFAPHQTLGLSMGGVWTPVAEAASTFPGSVWEGRFTEVAADLYHPGDLKIELLDAGGAVLSSGLNSGLALVEPGAISSATFFTIPAVSTEQAGALAAGQMKFWKTTMEPYVAYGLTVTASGPGGMPDIVVFDDLGRFYDYSGSGAVSSATHTLLFPRGGYFYIGVWADAGAVDSYELSLAAEPAALSEGFETGNTSAQPWVLSHTGTNSIDPTVISGGAAAGSYSLEFASHDLFAGGRTKAQLQKAFAADSEIAFWVKTDIGSDVSTDFILRIDGVQQGSWNGLSGSWSLKTVAVPAGDHIFEWSLEKNSNSRYPSATNKVWLDDISIKTVYPVTLERIAEGFEYGSFEAYGWVLSGDIVPDIDATVVYEGSRSAAFRTQNLGSGGSSSLAIDANPAVDSSVSFRFKTDIGTTVSTNFLFLIDGIQQGSWNGLDRPWVQASFSVPAGLHRLEWRAEKNSSSYIPANTNSVFLDAVSLVPDQAAEIVISPQGTVDAYVGMAGQRFVAKALRVDGSVKSPASFSYAVESVGGGNGTIDAAGLFVPTQAGTCRIRVSGADGLGATSRLITVHPADWIRRPFVYHGTTYSGQLEPGTGNPVSTVVDGISVSWPQTATFSADGFFAVEGSVSMPTVYDYALVKVIKDGTLEETSYFVRSQFKTRLWLRFGAGAYTVKVLRLTALTPDLAGEGDFSGWSYSTTAYAFQVTNTRDEDGIFRYPSGGVQSDDFLIGNIQRDLTFALDDERDKIKAIHDYVVQALYYDDASLVDGQRKKQDALSTLANGTGVCEGYTSLTTALLRSAGIPARAVSGTAGGPHAWNNILVDGSWLFLDSTWDDPYEQGDDSVRYEYFLLTDLTGIAGDHAPEDLRIGRAIVVCAPRWRGLPDGWY